LPYFSSEDFSLLESLTVITVIHSVIHVVLF
jgi:hypothetical protein